MERGWDDRLHCFEIACVVFKLDLVISVKEEEEEEGKVKGWRVF